MDRGLGDACAAQGLTFNMLRPQRTEDLPVDEPVFSIGRGTRELTVYPNSLAVLLLELVDIECWCEAMYELLGLPIPFARPWARMLGDSAPWVG